MEIQLSKNAIFYPVERKIIIDDNNIRLTRKETGLLNFLCRNKNELSYRSELLTEVWGDDNFFNGRSMDVYVCRIRKILNPLRDIEIVNVHSKGYKLIITESQEG